MAEKVMVRPGAGRIVRLKEGRGAKLTPENAPPEGVAVELSTYINRRIECGDLVVVEPAAPAPAIAKQAVQPAAGGAETKGA